MLQVILLAFFLQRGFYFIFYFFTEFNFSFYLKFCFCVLDYFCWEAFFETCRYFAFIFVMSMGVEITAEDFFFYLYIFNYFLCIKYIMCIYVYNVYILYSLV